MFSEQIANSSGGTGNAWRTFLPYRLRSSALMQTYFSPPMEKPLAKALEGEVKAEARELMSSWESYWIPALVMAARGGELLILMM